MRRRERDDWCLRCREIVRVKGREKDGWCVRCRECVLRTRRREVAD